MYQDSTVRITPKEIKAFEAVIKLYAKEANCDLVKMAFIMDALSQSIKEYFDVQVKDTSTCEPGCTHEGH